MTVRERLRPRELFTIPNCLSYIRILMIPSFIILFFKEQYVAATVILILSAVTDVVDGRIARKYNMISDFGKFIDPVADKLTQAATIICLISKYDLMYGVIAIFAAKEIVMFVFGFIFLKKSDIMNGAKWYGKVNTFITDAVMCALFLFSSIMNDAVAAILIAVCTVSMIASVTLYVRYYIIELKAIKQNNNQGSAL